MKTFFFVAMFVLGCAAQAGRKIPIPVAGLLKLTNPSATTVNFDLVCKNASGTTILNQSGQSLAANNTATYGSVTGSECAGGASKYTPMGAQPTGGMTQCQLPGMNYIPIITAQSSLCNSGYHVCSITEYNTNRNGSYVYGVLSVPATWSAYSYNQNIPGYEWQDRTGQMTHYASAGGMSVDKCSTASAATVAGDPSQEISYCFTSTLVDMMSNPMTTNSVVCCPNVAGNIEFCTVDIQTPAGHLISPQYLGGKAF